MREVNLLAVLVAAVAAFVSGGTYYAVLGDQLAQVSAAAAAAGGRTPPWKVAIEFLRCLVLAAVVAGVAAQGEIDQWTGGLVLGLALWIGFPFVLWTGAMLHENTPFKLAAIHAGDWLVKLLLIGVIVSIWQ
ncbi:MAG: DUF1761 domain-containing protein [Geodermatophilaceae bacterium]|nr:DUF1761 domain-containing protein [Geodermatophilaceae bacterium]